MWNGLHKHTKQNGKVQSNNSHSTGGTVPTDKTGQIKVSTISFTHSMLKSMINFTLSIKKKEKKKKLSFTYSMLSFILPMATSVLSVTNSMLSQC